MKWFIIKLIRFYQTWVSPCLPPHCRYYPTCSNYALMAIKKYGGLKGIVMGIARIMRCQPFIRGGYDPVPNHFTVFRNRSAEMKYRHRMNLKC